MLERDLCQEDQFQWRCLIDFKKFYVLFSLVSNSRTFKVWELFLKIKKKNNEIRKTETKFLADMEYEFRIFWNSI